MGYSCNNFHILDKRSIIVCFFSQKTNDPLVAWFTKIQSKEQSYTIWSELADDLPQIINVDLACHLFHTINQPKELK